MLSRPFLSCAVFAGLAASCAYSQSSSGAPAPTAAPPQTSSSARSAARSNPGSPAQDSDVYRNAEFGFHYSVIVGWVDRTREMQPDENMEGASAPARQGKVLLAVFERPPEVQSDAINPAVVIAQESAASYPGLKSAVDYVTPLTELVTKRGFQTVGDPAEITIDGRTLVQCDFKRDDAKRQAFQSTAVLLQKNSIISFTFIGATRDEVNELIDRLSFRRPSSAKPKTN